MQSSSAALRDDESVETVTLSPKAKGPGRKAGKTRYKSAAKSQAPAPAPLTVVPKTGFLRAKDEMIMLAIPTIGIFLCVLIRLFEKITNGPVMINEFSTLLTTLIFMDGVHVTFTFMAIACLPELRAWSTSEKNKPSEGWDKGWSFWKRMAVIAGALGLVVFVLKVSPDSAMIRGMATTWLFLELLGPSQHTGAQMRGISFVYNSTIRKAYKFTQSETARAASAEKLERLLFKGLIVGDVLYWLPTIFFQERFRIPFQNIIQMIGGVMVAASAIGLVANSLRYPKQAETDKTFFLSRVLLFPFKMLTPVGGLAIRATHGSEYLMIFRRLVQSSAITAERRKKVYLLTAAVSLVYGAIFICIWPGALMSTIGVAPSANLIAAGLFVTFVVRFTHYYMDALVFKMSDPTTRAAVSPLLVPKEK